MLGQFIHSIKVAKSPPAERVASGSLSEGGKDFATPEDENGPVGTAP
jgi:hypothetical protein